MVEARDVGFLGPGPVEIHVRHALALARGVETERGMSSPRCAPPRAVVDLGSGAGVPGLVLALRWPATSFLLVEAQRRRAMFLVRAAQALGLGTRVVVVAQRAEILGQEPGRRGAFDLVTARSFARPAVVAECAAPFLELGGLLVVAEPPSSKPVGATRWPEAELAKLGMGPARAFGSEYRFVVLRQESKCPARFPRRIGVPSRHPLF